MSSPQNMAPKIYIHHLEDGVVGLKMEGTFPGQYYKYSHDWDAFFDEHDNWVETITVRKKSQAQIV